MEIPEDVYLGDIVSQAAALEARSVNLLEEARAVRPKVRRKPRSVPVSVQPTSSNRKLARQGSIEAANGRTRNVPEGPRVSSTYTSIVATCPSGCPYRDNGCMAQAGMAVQRLDRHVRATGMSGLDVVRAECRAIDGMFPGMVPQDGARGGRDLRLHVSGDACNTDGARLLARSARRWKDRRGGSVWTFTHLWEEIPRAAWGSISVTASVEHVEQIESSLIRRYPFAITVQEHRSSKASKMDGFRIIPCPAETRGVTCVECRLCLDADRLRDRRTGIAFALHGTQVEKARRRLALIQSDS